MIESPFFIADIEVALDFLLISLLMVAHVSLSFPSQESILVVSNAFLNDYLENLLY